MDLAENHHSGRNGPRGGLSLLAGPALLLLISIGFFWKLVLTDQYTWLESPDLANQVLPWFQFQAAEWHHGRVPLWEPHLWAGQTLIGQAQPGAAYPLNWILFSLPLRHGWIRQSYLHWYFVLIHWMGAVFCYWLCRDLQRSRGASLLAGAAFGLGGYMGGTDWPQMLNGAVWAPLVFLFLLRALRGRRPLASSALAGLFLGVAWLSGHHQIPLFVSLAALSVWLFHVFRNGRPDWRLARLAAVFAVFVVFTSGLQTLPAYEYGKLAKRWVSAPNPVGWKEPVPYTVHGDYSLSPITVLGVVVPGLHRHTSPFLGVTALTAALLGLGLWWKRAAAVRMFTALGLVGLLLALGKSSVLHGILYSLVPMFEKARSPAAIIFIFHFSFCVLIAYGIDICISQRDSPWLRRAVLILTGAGLSVYALLLALIQSGHWPDERAAVTALAALLAALLLQGIRNGYLRRGPAVVLILMLMLVEIGNTTGYYYPNREEKSRTIYLSKLKEHADIAAFLQRQSFPLRVRVPDKDVPYNFGDWYGIDMMGGYLAGLPVSLLRLPYDHPAASQLFGVNYTVSREDPRPNQAQLFQSASGLRVFRNLDAWPRAWTVHQVRALKDFREIGPLLDDRNFDLRRTSFLLGGAPALEACEGEDTVRSVLMEPNHVVLEARMNCRGMVVLGDNWFPGWKATVDGRPAPIHEAYTVIRGVVADRGLHRIEMVFRPASVILGAWMTALGLLGAVLLAFRSRRRESEAAASVMVD